MGKMRASPGRGRKAFGLFGTGAPVSAKRGPMTWPAGMAGKPNVAPGLKTGLVPVRPVLPPVEASDAYATAAPDICCPCAIAAGTPEAMSVLAVVRSVLTYAACAEFRRV